MTRADVAVGIVKLISMFATIRALAPRKISGLDVVFFSEETTVFAGETRLLLTGTSFILFVFSVFGLLFLSD